MSLFKAEVSTRIRTHCRGCGISYLIELISEPIAFENEEVLFNQVKYAARELVEAENKCERCKKRTRQVSVMREFHL